MRLTLLIASLAVAALAAGCGGSKHAAATATTTTGPRGVTHDAPDLEALLPAKIAGVVVQRGSTTGSVVFGGDAFSKAMTRFLKSVGKKPADLRFANAQDPNHKLEAEVGVFQVPGLAGAKLATAIVSSSRPGAPGALTVSRGTLAGKQVIKVVYPGTSELYLYPSGDRVFYVGAQHEELAAQVLGLLDQN